MTGFDDSSDRDHLNDPEFQAELETVCKLVFKQIPDLYYDEWTELRDDLLIKVCRTKQFREYTERTNAKGYLYVVARNFARDILRNRKYLPPKKIVDLADTRELFSDWTEEKFMDYLQAVEIIEQLKPEEQDAIMAWLQGGSMKEIGETSIRPSKIFKKIKRLLKKKHK